MKKLIYSMAVFMSAITALKNSNAQTAEVQVIHNAADPAAANVDVYVNGALTLDDFAFRTATTFLPVPAGVQLNIGVAPGNSMSVSDTIKNFAVTLMDGGRYVAIANGVLDPLSFAANPDGESTAFTLFLQDNIQSIGSDPALVDFIAVHGASDAPTVDVIARNVATIVDDASYGDITGYVSVPPANYILDVTPAAGSPVVASFEADLSSLGGGAAVVLASGFLDPSMNLNGPAFSLIAVLPDGTVLNLSNVTGIEENDFNNSINVYPNPAEETLHIDLRGSQKKIDEISILDMSGRSVAILTDHFDTGDKSMNIAFLEKGIYILNIISGDQLSSRKLIVQ